MLNELKRLIEALDKDEDQICANLMRLALYTGMRRGEILGLRGMTSTSSEDSSTSVIQKGGRDQTIPLERCGAGGPQRPAPEA